MPHRPLPSYSTQLNSGVIDSQRARNQTKIKSKNGARSGNKKGSMDGTRRSSTRVLRRIVRGSTMGFYSQSFRFEGGGRHILGLKRSGKSCRLRWVNYLHPDLKRGKMTPHEEKLILELHSQWGNRWSKIARKLPGRTDNEIKNYWRTHMRKKAQEMKKRDVPPSSPLSNCTSLSSLTSSLNNVASECNVNTKATTRSIDHAFSLQEKNGAHQEAYSMDDIWKDITSSEEPIKPVCEESSTFSCPSLASPFWEYCPDTLWKMDVDEDSKMFFSISDPFLP